MLVSPFDPCPLPPLCLPFPPFTPTLYATSESPSVSKPHWLADKMRQKPMLLEKGMALLFGESRLGLDSAANWTKVFQAAQRDSRDGSLPEQ